MGEVVAASALHRARARLVRRTGAQRLGGALAAAGVTHAYVVAGHPIDLLVGECAKAGLRLIGARHQQGACLMSLAHNYVSGAVRSVVLVSAGPAASNCATGVLYAHDNRWPLLVIAGRLPSSPERPGAFQDFDAAGFYARLLRARESVDTADAIGAAVERTLSACLSASPGPAWLDVTLDALVGAPEAELVTPVRAVGVPPAGAVRADAPAHCEAIEAAAALLARARRPVLLLGEELRWSAPWEALHRLVDSLRVPFAASPAACGFLPQAHPLDVTTRRAAALADADLVLLAGTRVDWTLRHGAEFAAGASLVRMAREPDPGPGIALAGDEGRMLEALLAGVAVQRARGILQTRDEGWLARVCASGAARERAPAPPVERQAGAGRAVPDAGPSLDAWLDELAETLPADAITVLDGSVAMTRAQRRLVAGAPVTRLTPGRNGTMGVGVPFAIGARLARPDRPVVLVSGDFAFGLNALEIDTAVRHGADFVAVVANNGGINGSLRQRDFLGAHCAEPVMHYGARLRYDALAAALGASGSRAEAPGDLARAVSAAIAGGVLACVDVAVRADEAPVAAI